MVVRSIRLPLIERLIMNYEEERSLSHITLQHFYIINILSIIEMKLKSYFFSSYCIHLCIYWYILSFLEEKTSLYIFGWKCVKISVKMS